MHIQKKFPFLFGVVIVFFSFSAKAVSVIPMALDMLVEKSDAIVVARCTDIKSYWKDNKIYTDNFLEVAQTIKGEHVTQHVVTTLGGTAMHPRLKAPVNMAVPGGVSFLLGEELLLFTSESEQGIHQIVGFTQGKLVIETDVSTQKKLIPVAQKVVTNQPDESASLDMLFSPFALIESTQTRIRVRKIELSEMIEKIAAELTQP